MGECNIGLATPIIKGLLKSNRRQRTLKEQTAYWMPLLSQIRILDNCLSQYVKIIFNRNSDAEQCACCSDISTSVVCKEANVITKNIGFRKSTRWFKGYVLSLPTPSLMANTRASRWFRKWCRTISAYMSNTASTKLHKICKIIATTR